MGIFQENTKNAIKCKERKKNLLYQGFNPLQKMMIAIKMKAV